MKRNLLKTLAVACVTSVMLMGCGNTGSAEDNSSKGNTITVTDVRGNVEIPADPQRIVDLSGNSDILSILGYDVIGTANSDAYDYTKFPSYLEDTLAGAEILGYSMQDTMDIEAVMNLNPDLIVISTVQEKMYDQLSEIAPTVMIQLEALNWKDDVRSLAKVFDKEDKEFNENKNISSYFFFKETTYLFISNNSTNNKDVDKNGNHLLLEFALSFLKISLK